MWSNIVYLSSVICFITKSTTSLDADAVNELSASK